MNWNAELTRLRPWTYTHKFFINNYTNNGICLGFPHSGNSRLVEFTNETWINRRTKLKLGYIDLKHGFDDDNNYYGGDPTISYELRNPSFDNSTKWLMGDINTSRYFTMNLRYEIYNDSYINLKIIKHFENEKDLFINTGINLDI